MARVEIKKPWSISLDVIFIAGNFPSYLQNGQVKKKLICNWLIDLTPSTEAVNYEFCARVYWLALWIEEHIKKKKIIGFNSIILEWFQFVIWLWPIVSVISISLIISDLYGIAQLYNKH